MWLLSTARAELCFFPTIESARQAGYAILSHVWDEHEQSFQETAALRAKCAHTDSNPRDVSSPKVQASCVLAERHGFGWIWIDTCCIDKTSSAELSEAINAMYAYYTHAAVCYAYLRDVRRTDVVDAAGAWNVNDLTFDRSRWFTRGWTLQELVAPEEVVFLSQEWDVVGTKADLAALVAWITGIPAPVLRLEERIWDRSVAQRMSWAARRETTRPEDEAYCLMGLFSVHMPVLYGEGRNAFLRLQEEIMRVDADATLFAWGDVAEPVDLANFKMQQEATIDSPGGYLFAPSPRLYLRASNVVFAPGRAHKIIDRLVGESGVESTDPQQAVERVAPATSSSSHSTFAVTPYGVLAHLPVLEVLLGNNVRVTVAVLPVLYEYADRCSVLGLPLSPWHSQVDGAVHHSALPLYFCCPLRLASASGRLWELGGGGADGTNSLIISSRWRHIYLADRPPPTALRTCQLSDRRMSAPFRLKQTLVEELEKKGFTLSLPTGLGLGLEAPWDGDPPVALGLYGVHDSAVSFAVHLGRCAMSAVPGTGAHWVYVTELQRGSVPYNGRRVDDHDCLDDHILGGREDDDEDDGGATRTFELCDSGLSVVQITLTFVRWALSSSTYVVDIDVERKYVLSVEALNHELFAKADERDTSPISWSDRLSDDASIWNWTDPDDSPVAIGPQETDGQKGGDVSETGSREEDPVKPDGDAAGEPDEDDGREPPENDGGEPPEDDAEKDKLLLELGSEQAMQESSRRRKFWASLTTRFKTVRVSLYGQDGRS